jgi:hypothetical protein
MKMMIEITMSIMILKVMMTITMNIIKGKAFKKEGKEEKFIFLVAHNVLICIFVRIIQDFIKYFVERR